MGFTERGKYSAYLTNFRRLLRGLPLGSALAQMRHNFLLYVYTMRQSRACLLLILISALSISMPVAAQRRKPVPFDSSYYQTYPKLITGRVFFSQKYTSLRLRNTDNNRTLHYQPNNALNAGVGVTYGILTLNVGVPLRFVDPDNKDKGKTRSLDLQSHIYARKWVGDLFGQFYKGYYLRPKGKAAAPDEAYYTRPDLKVQMIGGALYRLFNSRQFSYRAAFLQNEWQKKSAGSFLLGGEVYYGTIRGDSALVPSEFADVFPQQDVRKARFWEVGPGAGYAYTWVVKSHFFLTGSATVNGDLSFIKEFEEDNTSRTRVTLSPNLIFRAVVGYNSDTWTANISWFGNRVSVGSATDDYRYIVSTGNYRLTVAKRFNPKGLLRKRLRNAEEKLPILSTEGK